MTVRFNNIPEPEQERILQIILEEFAEKGYLHASTKVITRKARIPKGTLFYYFSSKKDMFLFVLDEAVRCYTEIYKKLTSKAPDDLFEGLLHRMKIKMQFIQQEPLLYRFLDRVFLDIPTELENDMATRFGAYTKASQQLAKTNIDRSKFKDDVDLESVLRMNHLLLDGLFNLYAPQYKKMEPEEGLRIIKEIDRECRQYFKWIKKGIYK